MIPSYATIHRIFDYTARIFDRILISLDYLSTQIIKTLDFKTLSGNHFLSEAFLAMVVFIATIFLGIDADTMRDERIYRKKYIIMLYSIIMLIFIFNNGQILLQTMILSVVVILFLNAVSGINIGYNFDLLEKELGIVDFFMYSYKGWFYKAKTYMCIYLLVILFIITSYGQHPYKSKGLELNYLKELIMLVMIIVFFLLHMLMDIKDRFGYDGFDSFRERLLEGLGEDDDRDLFNINGDNIDMIEALGFILYVEDRDFFERDRPHYSLYVVIKRKIRDMILDKPIQRKLRNLSNNINNKETLPERARYLCKYIFLVIKKIFNYMLVRVRALFRGFSTLYQQIVRRIIMHEYSYNYTFRRKIFIETYYIKYFLRAYRKRKIKDKKIKRNWKNYFTDRMEIEKRKGARRSLINDEIRMELLMYYYHVVLESPATMNHLLMKLESQSIQTMESLSRKLNRYNNSYFKGEIMKKLSKGKVDMRNKYIFETSCGSNIDNPAGNIYIRDSNDGKKELDLLTSKPEEFGNIIAYICPYDFETQNNIYLYDLESNIKEEIFSWEESRSPKFLRWKSEKCLYVIMGETYGTITMGGDLYSLNILTGELKLLKSFPDNIQVTSFTIVEGGAIELKGIEYVDDSFSRYVEYQKLIDVE